jgi:hypothetical protein
MKNAVFWGIKTQFIPCRRHYVSATELNWLMLLKFEVVTAVPMKNAIFWDINLSSYLARNTLRLRYRVHPVNVM